MSLVIPVPSLDCNGRTLTLDRPRIMGIINATPDSFSGDGLGEDVAAAVAQGVAMVRDGADILDVGGESTRPGADPVDVAEQLRRVIPVVAALIAAVPVPVAVDTSEPEVMRAAVGAGAGLINDVRALGVEGALDAAGSLGVPVCLMHMLGEPQTMQVDPHYDDVVADVHRYLTDRLLRCEFAGIDRKRLLVDPGFGFGKSFAHNWQLLAGLRRFTELGVPVLAGLSRKGMVGAATGVAQPQDRVAGSVAAALLAVQRGAIIVRVHDVAETRDALAVWAALREHSPAKSSRSASPATRWDDDD